MANEKFTNPFHAYAEAISIFDGLGENPMRSGATYTEAKPGWPEEVLSVVVNRKYSGAAHYFVVEIHLTAEGFLDLVHNLNLKPTPTGVARELHSEEYTMLSIEFDSMLKIFCLVPKNTPDEVVL